MLERGEVQAACEKLDASNSLDRSAGTLLNLAACRLRQGKTATAWAYFVAAEGLARDQGRSDQAAEAKRRADELEPKLSTLTLAAREIAPGLELRRDGQVVRLGSLGSPVPVDPGHLVIEATAPGYEAVRLEIDMGGPGERRVVEPPRLVPVAAPRSASPPLPQVEARGRGGSSPGAAPWVIGGVGGAALVAGSVLGVLALSSNSEAIETCGDIPDQGACDQAQRRRDNQALASTISVGAGLVGIGVAAVWLLTGRSGRHTSAWSYDGEFTRESALLQMRVGF